MTNKCTCTCIQPHKKDHSLSTTINTGPLHSLFTYQLGLVLLSSVSMTKPAMVALSPSEELPVAADGRTVGATTGHISDVLALKAVNHLGTIVTPTAMISTTQ